jgi:hypothetical protein
MLWLAALFFPAIGAQEPGQAVDWYENPVVVIFGWAGLAHGIVGWFCNLPFVYIVVRLLSGREPPAKLAIANALAAATMFLPYTLFTDSIGGATYPMVRGPGFFLWFASVTIPAVEAALVGRRQRTSAARRDP